MGSKIALKNAQDQEFSINHNDNAGAISINSSDISLKSQTESEIAPYNKGFKNYIINGGFAIWQRGISFTNLTNGSYSADRWVVYASVGDINYNVIRNVGLFDGGHGITYTWNSGTGTRSVVQFIENVARFKVGTQVTVSFEAYTNSTPYTISVGIQGARGTWAAATGFTSANITLTNTKTRYTVTLTVPDWTTIGIDWTRLEDTKLALKFDMGVETNGRNFILSNVQLEKGSVATPFENRPYGLELSLCQRYTKDIGNNQLYGHIGNGFAFNSTGALIEVDVEGMRTIPFIENVLTASSFELETSTRHTLSAISINSSATANINKINLNCITTGLTPGWAVGLRNNNSTTNKIILSAEL